MSHEKRSVSAGEPFARVERGQGVWYELVVAGEYVGRHPDQRAVTMSRINAAVAARERAAAERALREAADDAMDEGCGGIDCNRPGYVHAEWLRSRADAIRDGRAT